MAGCMARYGCDSGRAQSGELSSSRSPRRRGARVTPTAVCLLVLLAPDRPVSAEQAQAAAEIPFFSLDQGHVDIRWDRGASPGVDATVVLEGPSVKLVWTGAQKPSGPSSKGPPPGPAQAVRQASPFPVTVGRIFVERGTLLFVDRATPDQVLLRVHDFEMTVENFSTRRERSKGLPTLVTARGRIGRNGSLALFVTLDSWTSRLNFSGRAQILGLQLDEVAGLVEQRVGVVPTKGTFSVFMQFSVQDDRLTGGVRPILSNAKVSPEEQGALDHLKAWFVQGALDLLSRDVGGEQRLATVVPLKGSIAQPKAGVWSAVVGVIERAFFQAIDVGYRKLPPEKGS
jgi:hypothetical protein